MSEELNDGYCIDRGWRSKDGWFCEYLQGHDGPHAAFTEEAIWGGPDTIYWTPEEGSDMTYWEAKKEGLL